MNTIKYKGYYTKIHYNVEDKILYGKIEGIKDLINFESDNIEDIENQFRLAVDDYLEMCKHYGKEPDKSYDIIKNNKSELDDLMPIFDNDIPEPIDIETEYCNCKITPKLRERFCKDMNLPIKTFDKELFMQRLELCDKQYDCINKYCNFLKLVNKIGSEQDYFETYNKLKDDVINYLKDNEKMMYFSKEEDMNKFQVTHKGFPTKDIYKPTNEGKPFLSFDMKKGNFTALKHYSPEIFPNCSSYEDFIGNFTDEDYFKQSKYIRQVIFGNINPRRQTTYEHYLMDKVLDDALKIFKEEDIAFFSTDEIVVSLENYNPEEVLDKIKEIVDKNVKEGINIRGEIFDLHKIEGIPGYIKEYKYLSSGYDIKGVDHIHMPMVMRELNGEKVQEKDLVFNYDKNLCVKIINPPEIRIPFLKNKEKYEELEK